MAFDAGAIVAKMRIDLSELNRDADEAERRMDRLAKDRKIHLSAVFDDASMAKARRMFAQLDQQLSRDAMQRLRSSPQGSVLGALNALFSPHQVAGGPTAQQAGSQGLLGQMVGGSGSGGSVGTTPNRNSTPTPGSVIQQVVQKATGQQPGAGTVTENVRQQQVGPNVGPQGEVTQNVRLRADDGTFIADAAKAGDQGGDAAATTFAERFRAKLASNSVLSKMFSGVIAGGGGRAGGGGAGGSFIGNLLGGIGPGILGVSAKTGLITAGAGSILGSLGPLLAGAGVLGLGAAGAGVIGLGAKTLIGKQNQQGQPNTQGPLYNQAQTVLASMKSLITTAAGGLTQPLLAAFSAIPKMLAGLGPILKQVFASAGTLIQPLLGGLTDIAKMVLPELSAGFKAVAPVLQPFLDGLGKLISGLLPGIITLVKAAMPAIQALSSVFGTLGKDLGGLFSAFAPVMNQTSVLFKALFDLIGALLPIIGKLGAVFASALAPVFEQFAGVVKALLPGLTIIGKVLGALAGAVLGDLVGAFGALASLLKAIGPGLSAFANAVSGVFNVLENTGVFAILGNALENLVGPLGKLINALLTGLAPILPPVINFIGQLSTLLAAQLANAITTLLPPLTKLATAVLGSLAQILPVIMPVLLKFAEIFTDALVTAISGVATAIAAVINAIPPPVLQAVVTGLLAIVAAIKLWAIAQAAINILLDANPLGLLVIAIAAVGVAIYELVKHWSTIWGEIKSIAEDAYKYLDNLFHNGIVQDILAIWSTGLIPLAEHWSTVWGDIKSVISTTWDWIQSNIIQPIETVFTKTLPGYFSTAVSAIGSAWGKFESVIQGPVNAVIGILNDLIGAFDDITNALGLGKPIGKIATIGGGGSSGATGGGQSAGQSTLSAGGAPHAAKGWRVPGWGGGDSRLVMVEPGETILPKEATLDPITLMLAKKYGVPGFQTGGIIGGILGGIGDLGKIVAGIVSPNATTVTGALSGAASLLAKIAGLAKGAVGGGLLGEILSAIPEVIAKDMESWLGNQTSKKGSSGSGGGYAGPGGGSAAANAALARRLYPAWATGSNWLNWNNVAMRESGWDNTIWNSAGSGAYGIAQALPFTKYPKAGWPASAGGSSNPTAQISWMHDYIQSVYGSPAAAWAHEMSQGWYDQGGWMRPGHGLARSGTGQPEAVLSGGQSSAFLALAQAAQANGGTDIGGKLDNLAGLMSELISTTAQAPTGFSSGLAGALGAAGRQASFRKRFPAGGS